MALFWMRDLVGNSRLETPVLCNGPHGQPWSLAFAQKLERGNDGLRCDLGLVGSDSHSVGGDVVTRLQVVRCGWDSSSSDVLESLNSGNVDRILSRESVCLGYIHRGIDSLASSDGLKVVCAEASLLVVHNSTHELKVGAIYIRV